jgi:hypothetical protein
MRPVRVRQGRLGASKGGAVKSFAEHLADVQAERERLIHTVVKALEYQLLNQDSVAGINERRVAEGIVAMLEKEGLA